MRSPFVPFAVVSTIIVMTLFQAVSSAAPLACDRQTVTKPADLVDTARVAGEADIFTAALHATGLAPLLRDTGPFTIFVPSDAAFTKLAPATLEALLQEPAALASVLAYHVVVGRVGQSEVAQTATVKTLHGESLTLRAHEGGLFVDGARIVRSDLTASNGIIHIIDRVALPSHGRTVSR